MKKVLLYSGGMDSWLIDKIWKPDVKLYIDINGAYSKEEIRRLPEDVAVFKLPIGIFEQEYTKYVPLRNLYFLMVASNYGDEICLGATAGDYGAKDKRPEFLQQAEDILNYCLSEQSVSAGKEIHIERRFVHMSKYEIMQEYLNNGGTIEEAIDQTFSCFYPNNEKECLWCKPCFRKFMLGYYFGYPYSKEQKEQMIGYIQMNVLKNQNGTGTYYKDRIGEGKYLAEAVDRLFAEFGMVVSDEV